MCIIYLEPTIYFEVEEYDVDESDGHVVVNVWRTGPDLDQPSSVIVRSRKSEVESAKGKIVQCFPLKKMNTRCLFFRIL